VVGRLVDLFGPKRLLLAGAALTVVAGVIGATAPNLAALVIARVVLGLGTCAGYPASMSLIRSEARRTGLASPSGVLTALAVSSQTIVVIGPTLGGLLIGLGGWRATLAVNIPLGLASLVVAAAVLPNQPRSERSEAVEPAPRARLDVLGVGLFTATLVALLVFLMSPAVGHLSLLGITAVAAALLTVHELRTAEPFLDLRLLGGNLPLLTTYARTLLAMTTIYVFLYGYTQWVEDSRGMSAAQAGLLLIPMSGVAIAVSASTGRHPAIRGKLIVGALAQLLGCLLLVTLDGSSAIWLLVVVAVVFGVPQGLLSLANQNALYHQADQARLASSAGLLRTFAYLGAIVAAAANGAFFGRTASTSGLHHIAVFLIAITAALSLLTLLDRSLARVGRVPTRPER
ncbi:MAG: MFS transporter, partial [Actinobacteria bacterium]|nr:MFS transporter [Actinomycetota bacterium]